MTTYEHAMVGIVSSMAVGVHQKYGWQAVAIAGVAAISPDWDALTFFVSTKSFDTYHRVLGHNFLVAASVAVVIAIIEYRYQASQLGVRMLQRLVQVPAEFAREQPRYTCLSLVSIAIVAAYSHLAADIVVSGGDGLSDWELLLLWPFSTKGFVFPLVAWGDPTITIIFATAMLAMLRWSRHVQAISIACLSAVSVYILRGLL